MKKNIFLNQKYLIKWTKNKSAFLIQSPFNEKAGIWWSKKWYQLSKYSDYFATGIEFDKKYKEIIYNENGIESINLISGLELFEKFNLMKNKNSLEYLKMALQTKNQLVGLVEHSIFTLDFLSEEKYNL